MTLTLNQRVRVRVSGGPTIPRQYAKAQQKLTYLLTPNSRPTTKTQGLMKPGLGPLLVLQTLRGKEPFYRRRGIQKERVIVPWGRASALGDGGFRFRRSGT